MNEAKIKSPLPNRLLGRMSSDARKDQPLCRGLLDYFPDALTAVSNVSKLGNDKHNPGEAIHHSRKKSTDHADCIIRHLIERGGYDNEGILHSAQLAWRALALLQQELEEQHNLPLPRGARSYEPKSTAEPEVQSNRNVSSQQYEVSHDSGLSE